MAKAKKQESTEEQKPAAAKSPAAKPKAKAAKEPAQAASAPAAAAAAPKKSAAKATKGRAKSGPATPAQPPPTTRTSGRPITGRSRAGSVHTAAGGVGVPAWRRSRGAGDPAGCVAVSSSTATSGA